jgi:hypothetical protein
MQGHVDGVQADSHREAAGKTWTGLTLFFLQVWKSADFTANIYHLKDMPSSRHTI